MIHGEGRVPESARRTVLTRPWQVESRGPGALSPLSSCTAGSGLPHLPRAFGGPWAEMGQPGLGWFWQSSTLRDPNRVSHLWEKDVGSHPSSEISGKEV